MRRPREARRASRTARRQAWQTAAQGTAAVHLRPVVRHCSSYTLPLPWSEREGQCPSEDAWMKRRNRITHNSAEGSRRQATDPDHVVERPKAVSASARGSTTSTTECLRQEFCSSSSGSDRQSVRKMDPRQSATRSSLLVDGWEWTLVRGWGKLMTYAVGCGRSGRTAIGEGGEAISRFGLRSQTMSSLSSARGEGPQGASK